MLLYTAKKQQPESKQPAPKAKKTKEPKQSVVTLVVSHSTSDKPACRKIIEGIVNYLDSVDERAAKYLDLVKVSNQYVCESI